MAQHDYNIGDQNGFDFLVDLNNALSAIATNNAGSSEPNTTFPHMLWFDTNNDLMKVRNEANSAWVIVAKKEGNGWIPYQPDNRYAYRSNNLSDLGSAATARANLGAAEDSSDPDFSNDPNAAARRGLVQQKLINLILDTIPGLVDAKLSTLPFSKEYQSTGQTMITGGLLTLAHGLAADPKLIRLYAIATAAADGFSIGDKLDLTATVNSFTGDASMGLTVTFDSTKIYIRNGSNSDLWHIPNKSTGTRDTLQRADFDLYVEAYA